MKDLAKGTANTIAPEIAIAPKRTFASNGIRGFSYVLALQPQHGLSTRSLPDASCACIDAVTALVVNSSINASLTALTRAGVVLQSKDGEATWSCFLPQVPGQKEGFETCAPIVGSLACGSLVAMVRDPSNSSILYAGEALVSLAVATGEFPLPVQYPVSRDIWTRPT